MQICIFAERTPNVDQFPTLRIVTVNLVAATEFQGFIEWTPNVDQFPTLRIVTVNLVAATEFQGFIEFVH